MSPSSAPLSQAPEPISRDVVGGVSSRAAYLAAAWTSLVFAVLQSVCTVLIGLGGARILISLLSLAVASSVMSGWDWLHRDVFRIPMMVFAFIGAIVNLIVVAQVRMLRNRPSARWRLDPVRQAKKAKQEQWQTALSVVTLILLAAEEAIHWHHIHQA